MCSPLWAHWRHLANANEFVLPAAQPSPQPKRQIDRFSRFCTHHGRKTYTLQWALFFPKIASSHGGSGLRLFMVALWNRADHYIFTLWFVMAALCNRGAIIFLSCSFLWSPYVIGQTIIFLPCDFYLSSFLLSSFFLSSPNLSGRRVDVYHTSTHGVALVRI